MEVQQPVVKWVVDHHLIQEQNNIHLMTKVTRPDLEAV